MTDMSVAEIDTEIARLKALKNASMKAPKIKKEKTHAPARHTRKIVCSNCGMADTRANMARISKYEYQHAMCPSVKKELVVRFEFQ